MKIIKKLLIFAMLLSLVFTLASCQVDAVTDTGDVTTEYYEIDVVQTVKDWSANNELSLFWEIIIFILAIPLIAIALVLLLAYVIISCVFELIVSIVSLVILAISSLIVLAMGFFGA